MNLGHILHSLVHPMARDEQPASEEELHRAQSEVHQLDNDPMARDEQPVSEKELNRAQVEVHQLDKDMTRLQALVEATELDLRSRGLIKNRGTE